MNYPVYAYRDIKVGFGAPQLQLNDQVAKRKFAQDINQPGSPLEFAPSDYELYKIADYETDNGVMKPLKNPEYMCNGSDVYGDNYHG